MVQEDFAEYNCAVMLWKIIPPFLILFGTTGNTLTIIVLINKRLRASPTSIFLATLALSDILALVTGLLRQWIKYTFKVDIREDLTVTGCRFHWFMVYVTTQCSSWMLICVTLERVISSYIPHRRRIFCKMRVACVVVGVIIFSLVLLNSHYLFGYGNIIRHSNNETVKEICIPKSGDYSYFISYSWTWVDLCVFYLVPLLFLLVGNSLIIYKVLDSHRRSRQAVAPSAYQITASQQSKTSGLTKLLLLVSIIFIVCVTPIVVYPIGEPYWKEGASDHKIAAMFLVETIANLLMYINHSVNFVIYFLSGTKFRAEVNRLICCKKATEQGQPTTISRSGL
jgi:hypothetical protein